MSDISPALLEDIQSAFDERIGASDVIRAFSIKVRDGTARMADLSVYCGELGKLLADTLQEVIVPGVLPDDRMYWNIAQSCIEPMIRNNHMLVNQSASIVQGLVDETAGITFRAIKPSYPKDRINEVLDYITREDIDFEEMHRRLGEPVERTTNTFCDDFMKANAEARYRTGIPVYVIREYEGAHYDAYRRKRGRWRDCDWCKARSGTWDYGKVNATGAFVWERHDGCRCAITYVNEKQNRKDIVRNYVRR